MPFRVPQILGEFNGKICSECISYNLEFPNFPFITTKMVWVRIQIRRGILDTALCDNVCLSLAAGWWFSPGTLVSCNLVEIRIPKKFSVLSSSLSRFKAYQRYSENFDPPVHFDGYFGMDGLCKIKCR